MANLTNKYKDRLPEDTIDILTKFFENKGFDLECGDFIISEIGTYSCPVFLKKNNQKILTSYGKGTSEKFAKASGLSELYERFCNKIFYINNPFIQKLIFNYQGYLFSEDEIELDLDDICNQRKFKDYFSKFKKLYKELYEHFYGVPFYNLINPEDKRYFDLRLLDRVQCSSGMSAGNTFEEACIQGMSELFEHHVASNFFKNENQKFYYLNLDNVNNSLIDKIKELNYSFYIIDASYTYHIPVLLGILVNKETNMITINFSSAPVFDIAVERILTEMYQLIKSHNIEKKLLLSPRKEISWEDIEYQWCGKYCYCPYFQEDIIPRLEKKEWFNKNCFYESKNLTNEELLNFYKKIAIDNNLNFYYYDCSQCKEMVALQIYCEKLDSFTGKIKFIESLNEQDIFNITNFILALRDSFNNLLNGYINIDEILSLSFIYKSLLTKPNVDHVLKIIMFNDWFSPYEGYNQEMLNEIHDILSGDFNTFKIVGENIDSFYYKYIKKYLTIYRYLNSGKYSLEEIKKILLFIEETFSDEDLIFGLNKGYLVKKIFLIPYYEEFTSEKYQKIIQSFLKEKKV